MLLKDASKTKNNQELVKASIDALVKALESGHSEALSAYLTAMSQFHNYSFQNILLIASQRPTATRVAGIRSWNELGRRVRRGEKGIMIFAPMIGYKRNAETDQRQQADARTDKPEPRLVGFRAVYVFERLSRELWPRLYPLDGTRSMGPASRCPERTLDSSNYIIAQFFCPAQHCFRGEAIGIIAYKDVVLSPMGCQQLNAEPLNYPHLSGQAPTSLFHWQRSRRNHS
jgi:N-terminal domain of anti-restriction factor ArdC